MNDWRNLRLRAKLASAIALLGCLAAQTATATAAPAKPALWKLSDHDTDIYLFGTIHILPKGLAWRTPALDKAIAESGELVLETPINKDLAATGQLMMKLAVSPGLPPLAERVPPERRAQLETLIKAAGLPLQTLDKVESWAAALMLTTATFSAMGYDSEAGVENSMAGAYAGKAITGIETVEQQLGFFDNLSQEAQTAFLLGAIDDPAVARAEFEAMLEAWRIGDTEGIARTFDSQTALSPELREALMTRRNTAWADWLEKKLDQPGTIMVAVGVGHLAGRDSVHDMLEARGLKAERVQ